MHLKAQAIYLMGRVIMAVIVMLLSAIRLHAMVCNKGSVYFITNDVWHDITL